MPEMPTLGYQPKKRSPLGTVMLIAVVAGISGGGMYWWTHRSAPKPVENQPVEKQVEQQAAVPAPSAADSGVALTPAAPVQPSPEEQLRKAGLRFATVRVTGPLETAVVDATNRDIGPALTQVITRSLVWWVEVPGDLKRNDVIEVLYEERANEEPVVHALKFQSEKLGKTVSTYRFRTPGEGYARYYQPDGTELELRLKSSPIDEYEQVTSLLRDGRRHQGVDFKAPVGTPIKAPFPGTVTRKNWNFRANGNSLELVGPGGKTAMFLHLNEAPTVKVGQRVVTGEVLAQSGNTGRSFAPHLHYQLMHSGGKVLDPFDVHETWRKAISPTDAASFQTEVRRLDALFPAKVAAATP